MPKKSNQKKGAVKTHDLPVPWSTKWPPPKCPRQSGNRSGSSNGSDTSRLPTERYTARELHPRFARLQGTSSRAVCVYVLPLAKHCRGRHARRLYGRAGCPPSMLGQRRYAGARFRMCVECVPFSEVRDADHMRPGFWAWIISIVLPEGMYLAAERSEDGASGRYTALSGGATSQNHCSNHSGFLTGADT